MTFTLFVPGTPAPQGSKRHVGRGILVESSQALKPWRATIAWYCHEYEIAGKRIDGALQVDLGFSVARPNSHFGKRGLLPSAPMYPTKKPDVDKLARAVLDALATDANVIADDARIVTLTAYKRWGAMPGVSITITEVTA